MTDQHFESQGWYGYEEIGKSVWEAAVERCIYTFETFEEVYVSFSGGKDSTATLQAAVEAHSVLGLKEPIKVVYLDDEIVAPETDEYVIRCMENMPIDLKWYCLPVRQRNSCSLEHPVWYPWGEEVRHLWVKDMPPQTTNTVDNTPWFPNDPIERRPTLAGYAPYFFADWDENIPGKKRSAFMLGIRVAESMMRRMIIAKHRDDPDHWMTHMGNSDKSLQWLSKVYPIFDWSETDVWTAPRVLEWDYNRIYDQYEALGLPPSAQRIGTPFGEEPSRGLWVWHQVHPELWDKMVDRVPGVRSAYRYSNSALYGKGETGGTGKDGVLPELAPGQTYRELLREVIQNYPDGPMRSAVAKKIQGLLNMHARKTSEPLLVWNVHPVSGLSWLEIIRYATLGDMKSRRSIKRPNNEEIPRARRDYEAEYERLDQEGKLYVCM